MVSTVSENPNMGMLNVNSCWRNPRKNDDLAESGINSWHQVGGAVDLTIPWLEGKSNFVRAEKYKELCELAFSTTTDTNVKYHLDHVHVEPSARGRTKECTGK
jgi:hypothetical protein